MKVDKVKINNFKSLKSIEIDLNRITVLTGINSSGKSSIIQGILILKSNIHIIDHFSRLMKLEKQTKDLQTLPVGFMEELTNIIRLTNKKISINNDFISLGEYEDVLFYDAKDDEIRLSFSVGNECLSVIIDKDLNLSIENYSTIVIDFLKNIKYISTNRIAPQVSYSYTDNYENIGIKGEYVAQFLYHNNHKVIKNNYIKHPDAKTHHLDENLNLWLSELGSKVSIKAHINKDINRSYLTYVHSYNDSVGSTGEYKPTNIGFGLTYCLPILISLLCAEKYETIIIENPESHLHPSAQSILARLCALTAKDNIQLIIETHSDHFFNAIRAEVKEGNINHTDISFKFFYKSPNRMETYIDNIDISRDGQATNLPQKFFDEFDIQLDRLIEW